MQTLPSSIPFVGIPTCFFSFFSSPFYLFVIYISFLKGEVLAVPSLFLGEEASFQRNEDILWLYAFIQIIVSLPSSILFDLTPTFSSLFLSLISL